MHVRETRKPRLYRPAPVRAITRVNAPSSPRPERRGETPHESPAAADRRAMPFLLPRSHR
jgi:hypothetical protein